MKIPTSNPAIVTKVKQIMETDSIEAANALLDSGHWILLNSYRNRSLSNVPVCRLGRITEFETTNKTV
jgi:hypothetical protein